MKMESRLTWLSGSDLHPAQCRHTAQTRMYTQLFLQPGFTLESVHQVQWVLERLAAVGLRINIRKCLAVAQAGCTFSDQDRQNLQAVGIPFIDSSTPAAARGFAPMNVPIGSDEFVEQQLKRRLFDPKLWRLSWQSQVGSAGPAGSLPDSAGITGQTTRILGSQR